MNMTARARLKQHLISWATAAPLAGPAGAGVGTLVLADAAHIPAVTAAGLVGPRTLLLAPDDGTGDLAPAVGYQGSLTEPGDEFSNGQDFFLQTHAYAASPFMTVFGPTVIRVFDRHDFEAFLADADRALAEGVFPEFLITSSVLLADPAALSGASDPADGPALRLYADRNGQLSISPTGAVLGTVDESLDILTERFARTGSGAAALDAALPAGARAEALRARPFLARYLEAVGALRSLMARGATGLRVSGFGSRLTPGLAESGAGADLADPALPIVLYADSDPGGEGEAYIVAGNRLFAVDRRAAQALECLLATSGETGDLVPAAELDQLVDLFSRHDLPLPVAMRVPAAAR
ncbi:daptide biosynthesis RiPP recognition protein [Streptomyces sp. CA-179760]|uniref:daptide biosynthesis RiPP recognition protein n=1 Tax=Streptomyces sp. CA-179760 TaxID=3240054 RepID=UPI003D8CF619